MTSTIHVGHGDAAYRVAVGSGILDEVAGSLDGCETAVVVHSPSVADIAADVAAALSARGMRARGVTVPDGESAKDLEVVTALWGELAAHGVTRTDAVVAVGGGAVTDVAGFAGATWLRGVRVVHVPTTLLGMVDASIGGKTAINTPAGKNLVGAFHDPAGVVVDLDLLATLPRADLAAGLAEVVKAGFIADPVILDRIEADPVALLAGEPTALRDVVERAIRVKADVVGGDPTERGRREILNYGHTLAHAIEKTAGFGVWRHGDAVSVGLCFAATVARLVGTLDTSTAARHADLLSSLGLPTRYDGDWAPLRAAMTVDKKSRGARLRFVVLEGLGRPVVLDDPPEQILEAAFAEVTAS
ncbi:MAG TPA: 3-dehydroquinate synthase [Mycobacteriales bacterium]|nr:3-dehydroquinate synthase [Mycobacteriales bacterium]